MECASPSPTSLSLPVKKSEEGLSSSEGEILSIEEALFDIPSALVSVFLFLWGEERSGCAELIDWQARLSA